MCLGLCAALLFALPGAAAPAAPADAVDPAAIEAALGRLSTEQKVAQLMMIGFAGTRVDDALLRWVAERRVGGVALFSRNLRSLAQTAQLTHDLQVHSVPETPLFIAVDQEGGNVVRLRDAGLMLPGNMALGATRDPKLAYVAGQSVGSDLRLLGINMNMAPVLDINSNPRNPVIGIRAYGETPALVGLLGAWFIRGQQEMGVVAVAKHFPGHGNTQNDSHFSLPSIDVRPAHLRRVELQPFAQGIAAGLDAVMTAHIALPRLTGRRDLPATLSKAVLGGLLRQELGFAGVVMTDGLEMRSIQKRFGSARAAVMAVQAGADMPMILWEPGAEERVYRALLRAVQRRQISMARLNQSVRRILTVKWRRGLQRRRPVDPASAPAQLQRSTCHAQLAAEIARRSLTLVRNPQDFFPLAEDQLAHLLVLAPPGPFGETLRRAGARVIGMPMVPSRSQRAAGVRRALAARRPGDRLLAGLVNRYHLDMVRAVTDAAGLPAGAVSFASPYYLRGLAPQTASLCAYGYLNVSQEAAADAVLGRYPVGGQLPVSIPGVAPYGAGLRLPKDGP